MKLEQALDDLDVQLTAGSDAVVLSRDAASILSTVASGGPLHKRNICWRCERVRKPRKGSK